MTPAAAKKFVADHGCELWYSRLTQSWVVTHDDPTLGRNYHYVGYRWSAETDQTALLDWMACAKDHTVRQSP